MLLLGAMVPGLTRPRHAFAHLCCYLSQTVRVTLKFSRRNGRSRKKIQKKTRDSFCTFFLPGHPWPPGDPPPQGTLPETPQRPPDPPRDFPWRFPEPPRDLDGRTCHKIYENWSEWVRHESPRAHIRRGRSYGLSDASGTLPSLFSINLGPFAICTSKIVETIFS